MGIINLNPGSFYASSVVKDTVSALAKVERMLVEGMDILDLGAMTSRPGVKILDPELEQAQLLSVLLSIRKEFDFLPISVDTLHASTAEKSLDIGADAVNDISGGKYDCDMLSVISRYQCSFIAMQMRGIPENMQSKENTQYQDVVSEVISDLAQNVRHLSENGIHKVIIDPGFGFSKTIDQNYQMLNRLELFDILGKPVLAGLSRKSMFWKRLSLTPEEVLPATLGAQMIAITKGISILRVHDVQETGQILQVFYQLNNS